MNHLAPSSQIIRTSILPATPDVLRIRFGDHVSMSEAVRVHHGRDESAYNPMLPDVIVFTQTTEGVAAVTRLCFEHEISLILYGTGPSLEDHPLAMVGGVSFDLSQMNHVLSAHPEDLTVTVEPDVMRKQLNTEIRDTGSFFSIDPGADTFIGGMCVTHALGTNVVRYGTMHENILNLTVVTVDGRIIKTADRARKSPAGYDLTRLLIGSEGTLGIITEIILKPYPQPEAVFAAVCAFPSMGDAISAVIDTIQTGMPIARVEFVDTLVICAISQYDKLTLLELPTLSFEFHGSEHGVQEQIETAQQIVAGHKGQGFEQATRPEDRSRPWNARHNAYFAFLQLKPGCRAVTTDVCVPISRLVGCAVETEKGLPTSTLQLPAPTVDHVGDGSLHVALLIDPNKPEELEKVECINQRIVARATAMDGTCTGEHGVDLHKTDFFIAEHDNDAIDLMRSIKQASDPKHALNPGRTLHL